MKSIKRFIFISLLLFIGLAVFTRIYLGVFVVQPMGIITSGKTVVYWRHGLNVPFISSANGLLGEKGKSLIGKGITLATLAKSINKREILSFRYSEALYWWSTR